MNFFPSQIRTDRQTESDAYEPTVHKHRWAQKLYTVLFGYLELGITSSYKIAPCGKINKEDIPVHASLEHIENLFLCPGEWMVTSKYNESMPCI